MKDLRVRIGAAGVRDHLEAGQGCGLAIRSGNDSDVGNRGKRESRNGVLRVSGNGKRCARGSGHTG